MPFEDEYFGALMSLESAIHAVYQRRPTLADSEVEAALEAVVRRYQAEQRNRPPRPESLTSGGREVSEGLWVICEVLLSRAEVEGAPAPAPLTLNEVMLLLKRIRKSVRHWRAEGGTQGYLNFVRQHLPG